MKRVSVAIALAAALFAAGCGNKDLQNADNLAATGDLRKAVEAYNKVIESGRDADRARISLAGVYCTQKEYEKALGALSGLTPAAARTDEVNALREKCTAAGRLLDAIKSATVRYRQHFIKQKEISHQELDYTVPIFTGTAAELFEQSGVKPPAAADLAGHRIEIRQTDDPLEPTRLAITFPDGSVTDISLNY